MRGLLLLNLGTPEAPTTRDVRRYLAEFLSDPRVIDIHPIARALLLHLVILRVRPAKSARAYQAIWDAKRGSPLLYHSQDLATAVAEHLGTDWHVELAMRYGKPSIADAMVKLRDASPVVVMPLFPQYASSSTGTALARVMELAGQAWNVSPLSVVPPFYDDPAFISAYDSLSSKLHEAQADHVLFSFHGLPVRHVTKSGSENFCLQSKTCCDAMGPQNRDCYRAQCFATARALVTSLGIAKHTIAFQSRLGRTPWILPHTDVVLDELAAQGVKRLAVMCPAFVADCLETVEEIGIRARAQFRAAGGEDLVLIPCLNANPEWARAVAVIARRHA